MTTPEDVLEERLNERLVANSTVREQIYLLSSKGLRALGDLTPLSDLGAISKFIKSYNECVQLWNEGSPDSEQLAQFFWSAYSDLARIEVLINMTLEGIPISGVSDGTLEDNQRTLFEDKKEQVTGRLAEMRASLGL